MRSENTAAIICNGWYNHQNLACAETATRKAYFSPFSGAEYESVTIHSAANSWLTSAPAFKATSM